MALNLRVSGSNATFSARGGPFLPDWQKLDVTVLFSEVGNASMDYALLGVNADLLVDQAVIAVYDDELELPDARWVLEGINGNVFSNQGVLYRSYAGRNLWKAFEEAIVYTSAWPTYAPGDTIEYSFTSANPGQILSALINKSQAQGELAGITFDFNATNSSSGVAWTKTASISYEMGTPLLSVLQNLIDQGLCEVKMEGSVLRVFNPDSLGTDRSTGSTPLIFWGANSKEAPEQRDSRNLRTRVMMKGDDNVYQVINDAPAQGAYGVRTMVVSQQGVKDSGTLTAVGQFNLDRVKQPRSERTYSYELVAGQPIPFRDYFPGDYVLTDVTGTMDRVRVRQISIKQDSGDAAPEVTLVLNDRFLEAEDALARKVNGITGGATLNPSGLPASTLPKDKVAPAQVAGLTGSSTAYVDAEGKTLAQITLDWADLTLNADGSTMGDFARYEVWGRKTTPAGQAWRLMTTATDESFATMSNFETGTAWSFKVRAIDKSNNVGAYSTEFALTTASDATAPTKPSAPTTASKLGTIRINWNGNLRNANTGDTSDVAPPNDFLHIEVHVSSTSGFTPSVATLLDRLGGAGSVVLANLDPTLTYYTKFIAVDRSGNKSPASTEVGQAVIKISGPDLVANSVTANEIQAGAIGAEELQIGSVQANKTLGPAGVELLTPNGFEDLAYWTTVFNNTNTDIVQPQAATDIATGFVRSTGQYVARLPAVAGTIVSYLSARFPLPASRTVFLGGWCNQTAAITGPSSQARLRLYWYDASGTQIGNAEVVFGTPGGSFTAWEFQQLIATAPTGAAYFQPAIAEVSHAGSGGQYIFDDVSCMACVGTSPERQSARLSPAGLELFDQAGNKVIDLTSTPPNYFAIFDSVNVDGDPNAVASIDSTGAGSFAALSVKGYVDTDLDGVPDDPQPDDVDPNAGFTVYGKEFVDWINALPRGVVAWEVFGADSAAVSAETGYGEIGGLLYPDRVYKLSWRVNYESSVAGGQTNFQIRVTRSTSASTAAASPTVTSLIVQQSQSIEGAAGRDHAAVDFLTFVTGETVPKNFRFLLTQNPVSGTSTIFGYGSGVANLTDATGVVMLLEDIGPATIGQSGAYNTGGGATAPAVTTTKIWTATGTGSYRSDGSRRTDTTDGVQGYNSANGDQRAAFIFPNTITSTISGGTIKKIEVYLYANHWYYNSGGTALLKVHGLTSVPASAPTMTTAVSSSKWPKPGGRWVTLPSSLHAGFLAGTYKGFGVGPAGSSNLLYYGRFNGSGASSNKPQIRITYTK